MLAFLFTTMCIMSSTGDASQCSASGAAWGSCGAEDGANNLIQTQRQPVQVRSTPVQAKFYTFNQGNPDRDELIPGSDEKVTENMFDLIAEDLSLSTERNLDFVAACWQENDDHSWWRYRNNFCGSSRGCTHSQINKAVRSRLIGSEMVHDLKDAHYKKSVKARIKYGAELEIFDSGSKWTFDKVGGWTGKGGVVGCRDSLFDQKKIVVICTHLSTRADYRKEETENLLDLADKCLTGSGAKDAQMFFLGDVNYRLRFPDGQAAGVFLENIKGDFQKYPLLASDYEDLPTLTHTGSDTLPLQKDFVCDPISFPTYPRAKGKQDSDCLGASKQDTFDCWKYKGNELKKDKHSKDGSYRLTLGQLDRLCWTGKESVTVVPKRFYGTMSDHIMVGFDVSF